MYSALIAALTAINLQSYLSLIVNKLKTSHNASYGLVTSPKIEYAVFCTSFWH